MATRLKKGEVEQLIKKYIEDATKTELLETEEFLQRNLLQKVGHCDPRTIRAAMAQIQDCNDYPELFEFLLDKKVRSYSDECYFIEGGEMKIR